MMRFLLGLSVISICINLTSNISQASDDDDEEEEAASTPASSEESGSD